MPEQSPQLVPFEYKPGFRERLKLFLKGAPFATGGTSWGGFTNSLWSLLPGTNFDYMREVGNLWQNSIVQTCLSWQCRTFSEAPPVVRRQYRDASGDLKWQIVDDHPLTRLWLRPNDWFDETQLQDATLLSGMMGGNCYIEKLRATDGTLNGLNWLPYWLVEPRWDTAGKQFITAYEYKPGNVPIYIDPVNMIHIRFGPPDPDNIRKALGPLDSVFREIALDNSSSTMVASLARNVGVPGVVIMPKVDGVKWSEERAKDMKAEYMARFGGDKMGEPYVLTTAVDMKNIAWSPTEMNLEALRRLPEARVCSNLGIAPVVLYLQVGMDKSTYNNVKMAYDAAWHSNIIPTQRRIASAINRQLLWELGNPKREKFGYDLSQVYYLQQDQTDLANRVATLYNSGIIMRSQALEMLDLPFTEADHIYKTDIVAAGSGQGEQPNLGNSRNPMPSLDDPNDKHWDLVVRDIARHFELPIEEVTGYARQARATAALVS